MVAGPLRKSVCNRGVPVNPRQGSTLLGSCGGVFAVGAGCDDKTVAGNDRAPIKVYDGKAKAFDCDAIDCHAVAFGQIVGAAGVRSRIGCAVAGHVNDADFAIGHQIEQWQRKVDRLARGGIGQHKRVGHQLRLIGKPSGVEGGANACPRDRQLLAVLAGSLHNGNCGLLAHHRLDDLRIAQGRGHAVNLQPVFGGIDGIRYINRQDLYRTARH